MVRTWWGASRNGRVNSGFSQTGVTGVDLATQNRGLLAWLSQGCHGEMDYMAHHGLKRRGPAELVPGTLSVITARMDYLPRNTSQDWLALNGHGAATAKGVCRSTPGAGLPR